MLTTGTLVRFSFNSTVEHLITPMVRAGHVVDVYLSLLMKHQTQGLQATVSAYLPDPALQGKSDNELKTFLSIATELSGGRLRHLDLVYEAGISGSGSVDEASSLSSSK